MPRSIPSFSRFSFLPAKDPEGRLKLKAKKNTARSAQPSERDEIRMFARGFYLDGGLPTALQMLDVFSFVLSFESARVRRLMVNSRKYQVLDMFRLVLNGQRSIVCAFVCVCVHFVQHKQAQALGDE